MKKPLHLISLILITLFFFVACSSGSESSGTKQKLELAETVFQARLFQPLAEGETLNLEIVDEVTGIALNPTRYRMDPVGSAEYTVRLPLAIGSVIRYRYVRNGSQNTIEKDSSGGQVLYRLYMVKKPGQVNDLVAGWDKQPYLAETGEISGYVYDSKTEAPLGEILISVNGLQTYSSFDGFYKFEKVPVGEFPIVALHTDGLYETFQQNAVVANNSVTPSTFGMNPAKLVNVTFEVRVPEVTESDAIVRLLGNLHQLGNSFAELRDGTSLVPSVAPVMSKSDGNLYEITLPLPAGFDLRYKYSLGDGFVNAEHASDSSFLVRQLIVPSRDAVIRDRVETWYSGGSAPVKFQVSSPVNTPASDSLSIQFNPYAWMQPIPMWPTGENSWTFTLYGPFNYLDQAQYRFCRNNQCGVADDVITRGINGLGYLLDLSNGTPLTINYQIAQWFGLEPINYDIAGLTKADHLLIKGFEITAPHERDWLSHMDAGLIDAAVNGGNWLFFNPTWTFKPDGNAGLNPRNDTLAQDLHSIMRLSNDAGLSFALFPKLNADDSDNNYWRQAELSYNWWQRWFTSYQRFILNYVDFASQQGINTIIIGGRSVSPAFPKGKLPNGSFSNTPYDFEEKWLGLISEIRARYPGQIGFALPYSSSLDEAPAFISQFDFIFIEMNSALSATNSPGISDLRSGAASAMDNHMYKLYATFQKPIILGLDYTSIDGSGSDCLNLNSSCSDVYRNTQNETLLVDINEQADVYRAILLEAAARPFILGIVSQGFNPAVAVQDASSSVHGKPAMQVLSSFFR
ncbi:MAG: hypothetical protein FJZ98_02275 [Chloroflexi bacterium]|nr:hypothetical protein [Chloroflexota bacterium]